MMDFHEIYVYLKEILDEDIDEIMKKKLASSTASSATTTTGTTTTLDFPEGTGSPFVVGNAVSLTVTGVSGQENLNFTHKIVSSVVTSAGVGGYYSTRVVVDHDSSSVTDALLSTSYAELRGSFMVAAYGDGTGTLHYQQVQHT